MLPLFSMFLPCILCFVDCFDRLSPSSWNAKEMPECVYMDIFVQYVSNPGFQWYVSIGSSYKFHGRIVM